MDQHRGGKWLIQDTIRRKDNRLQSLELWNILVGKYKHNIVESGGNMFSAVFKENEQYGCTDNDDYDETTYDHEYIAFLIFFWY